MQGVGIPQNKPLSLRESGRECQRNPLQRGGLHKECRKGKRSLLLPKTVILTTYETPVLSALRSTILTVMGRNRGAFTPGRAGINKDGYLPHPRVYRG